MYKRIKVFDDYFKAKQSLKWHVLVEKLENGKYRLSYGIDRLIERGDLLIKIPHRFEDDYICIATCNSEEECKSIYDDLVKLPKSTERLYDKNFISIDNCKHYFININDVPKCTKNNPYLLANNNNLDFETLVVCLGKEDNKSDLILFPINTSNEEE